MLQLQTGGEAERSMEILSLDCQEVGEDISGDGGGIGSEMEESDITIELYQVMDKSHLKCDQCEKIFSSSYYLQYHVNYVHCDQKIFKCDSCNKRFKAPNHLKLHVQRIHNSSKQFF